MQSINEHINYLFSKTGKADIIPSAGSFSGSLSTAVGKAEKKGLQQFPFPRDYEHSLVMTSIEMWHRAIHSFLISSATTSVSPIWSSVSGYYSSHYTFRALAHLIGYFQLYREKKIIYSDIEKQVCEISAKNKEDKEHKYYWKIVATNNYFGKERLFNVDINQYDKLDNAHRNRANYIDNVNIFPIFKPLDKEQLKARIEIVSKFELPDVLIPRIEKFPDVDRVQLIAYHRIVRYRKILDECVDSRNKVWKMHRSPEWCKDFVKFQATPISPMQSVMKE
jgi:hypothetical protein